MERAEMRVFFVGTQKQEPFGPWTINKKYKTSQFLNPKHKVEKRRKPTHA